MMGGGGAQMNMSGMGMTEHTAGRIAFLRAELQITDAQSKAWDAFADALHKIGSQLKAADMPMMTEASAPQLLARLDSQERMLTARLEGVRAMKAAFAPLYDALSAEQRKTADDAAGKPYWSDAARHDARWHDAGWHDARAVEYTKAEPAVDRKRCGKK